jgi:hypothetical protein
MRRLVRAHALAVIQVLEAVAVAVVAAAHVAAVADVVMTALVALVLAVTRVWKRKTALRCHLSGLEMRIHSLLGLL